MIPPIRAQGDPYQQHQGQEFAGPKVCFFIRDRKSQILGFP